MDKNAIKKFAVWARQELIFRVKQKAAYYGITEDWNGDTATEIVMGRVLSEVQKKQYQALVSELDAKDFKEVMEEVAYTWFNRFIALRFMEVNGYLPTRVRVFTNAENQFEPQILEEALHLDLDGLDKDHVYELKNTNQKEELYKYLLIAQCNALNSVLPGMFQQISDYTELLFPDNLLNKASEDGSVKGSILCHMIMDIPEEDWKDAVQIIGWLYQYYNAQKKDEVFAALKKNVKITKENIPAATQLFTPDWIVRYMVENSLGRLWVEGHPNDDLKASWKYYLEEVEQEPEVQAQLTKIRKEYAAMKPEEIKCIDPCCGSGHILAYLFDVLVQIYESYGYTTREAVENIIRYNLYGLDIDDRAAQLAYFSVMMKACEYDSRFLKRKDENGNPKIPQPKVYAIQESNTINRKQLKYFGCQMNEIKRRQAETQILALLNCFQDAKEYGSILSIEPYTWELLYRFVLSCDYSDQLELDAVGLEETKDKLFKLVQLGAVLAQKYDVVCTNPPYMAISNGDADLNNHAKKYYPDSKSDFFAIFMETCDRMIKKNGYQAMITQHSWMFLSSFEKLRTKLLQKDTINMAHLGARAFEEIGGEVVQTTSFVMRKNHVADYKGIYCRLIEPTTQQGKEDMFLSGENRYVAQQSNFSKIPGSPVAYWVSMNMLLNFDVGVSLSTIATPRTGIMTGDNGRFLRLWWEVMNCGINFSAKSAEDAQQSCKKWFPYNKGGEYRKWYGNNDYVINWEHGGLEVFENAKSDHRNAQDYPAEYKFKPAISWSLVTSGEPAFRVKDHNLSDIAGPSLYTNVRYFNILLAFCNSCVALRILTMVNPTINFQGGNVGQLPVLFSNLDTMDIDNTVNECITTSKRDWDSFETSWDFHIHPLVRLRDSMKFTTTDGDIKAESYFLQGAYRAWENECEERFTKLKANEEELNRIFIDIYGLQDELIPEVEDKDVTVRKADLQRDIKSLISYAVGCMFGRYSLYNEGLLYAGGPGKDFGSLVEKIQDYLKAQGKSIFPDNEYYPDADNIIPICDDEYFGNDDIVGRFVKFIEIVYGKDTLDENLKFIADALGGKGQPREVIRNYFLNDFYADHCKIYQKRPIYWLFDSGKKNGFKALIYMHRYQPDTIARIRTDYVHEQQSRYHTAIADMENRIANAATGERVKLNKALTKLKDQDSELRSYEEKIHHLADQMIAIDLDDGVKVNYAKFQDVLAKIK